MTSTTTARIITTALAILALAAPVASAMPIREAPTSSLAGTTSPDWHSDMRNPDNQAPRPEDAPKALAHVPAQQPQTMTPVPAPKTATPVAATDTDDGPSPLVFILPGLVLIAMVAAGYSVVRTSHRPAQQA
jgi:hypothetical protein